MSCTIEIIFGDCDRKKYTKPDKPSSPVVKFYRLHICIFVEILKFYKYLHFYKINNSLSKQKIKEVATVLH